MRHAQAESGAQMDPTRDLTDTGRAQAKMMGKWLKRQTEQPDLVVQSNFLRSKETAARVGKKLGLTPIDCPMGLLDPSSDPEATWTALKGLATDNKVESIIAVTHGPLVERLLAYLTGSPLPQQFHFAHAAVAHFESADGLSEAKKKAKGKYTYDEVEMKRWILDDGGESGNCEVCEENEAMGWIDMDATFLDTDGGDIDESPAHPNCECTVEFKTKRVRVYESGARIVEDASTGRAVLHWLLTPNVVARDEDEMDAVTKDAHATVEAALDLIEDLV